MSTSYFSHNHEIRELVEELYSKRHLKDKEILLAQKMLEYLKWNKDKRHKLSYLSYISQFPEKIIMSTDVIFLKLRKLGVISGEKCSCDINLLALSSAPPVAPLKIKDRRRKNIPHTIVLKKSKSPNIKSPTVSEKEPVTQKVASSFTHMRDMYYKIVKEETGSNAINWAKQSQFIKELADSDITPEDLYRWYQAGKTCGGEEALWWRDNGHLASASTYLNVKFRSIVKPMYDVLKENGELSNLRENSNVVSFNEERNSNI